MSWVQFLAWQFANIIGILGCPKVTKKLGSTWAREFLKWFPHLTCSRAMDANEPNVKKWFTKYETVLSNLKINGDPNSPDICKWSGQSCPEW